MILDNVFVHCYESFIGTSAFENVTVIMGHGSGQEIMFRVQHSRTYSSLPCPTWHVWEFIDNKLNISPSIWKHNARMRRPECPATELLPESFRFDPVIPPSRGHVGNLSIPVLFGLDLVTARKYTLVLATAQGSHQLPL